MKMNRFAEALRGLGHTVDCKTEQDDVDVSRYDVVHSYNLNWRWTTHFRELAQEKEVPFVLSTIHFDIHDSPEDEQRKTVDYASRLVMFSEKEKDAIEKYLKIEIPREKSFYLHNGVSDEFTEELEWRDRDIDYIMVVNTIAERKNCLGYARAVRNLEARGVLVGTHDMNSRSYFERVAAIGNLDFHQRRLSHEELNKLYNRSKCVVAISFQDPFPNPVLEGTACGCNVVVSNMTYVDLEGPWIGYVDPVVQEDVQKKMEEYASWRRDRPELPGYREQAEKLVKMYEECLV